MYGKEPVYDRAGGTIGLVSDLKEHLDLDCVMLAFDLPDDNLHAPNERFRLEQFDKGMQTAIRFLAEYSK